MPKQERTHKLQLESVTLNFRLWDGPPVKKDREPFWHETPEYHTGRMFATVEVYRLGTYIRTLNETQGVPNAIKRSLTTQELRLILADIEEAVARVKQAGLPDPSPNPEAAEDEDNPEDQQG